MPLGSSIFRSILVVESDALAEDPLQLFTEARIGKLLIVPK
jgi:hypothetical protein